jgi:hypothetical protein
MRTSVTATETTDEHDSTHAGRHTHIRGIVHTSHACPAAPDAAAPHHPAGMSTPSPQPHTQSTSPPHPRHTRPTHRPRLHHSSEPTGLAQSLTASLPTQPTQHNSPRNNSRNNSHSHNHNSRSSGNNAASTARDDRHGTQRDSTLQRRTSTPHSPPSRAT